MDRFSIAIIKVLQIFTSTDKNLRSAGYNYLLEKQTSPTNKKYVTVTKRGSTANEPDAWIWHGIDEDETSQVVAKLSDLGNWHPFGYQNFVELLPDPDAPCQLYNRIYLRGGARSLAAFWKKQRQQGLSHVIVNLKPIDECLEDFNIFDQVNED